MPSRVLEKVSSMSDAALESRWFMSAMVTDRGVAVSLWLSMCRRYMSSTFSRSTSAFHSNWSMCLQATFSFFLALALLSALPELSDFCRWFKAINSLRACCKTCVVWSTSSCMRRISISSSWASSSWTKTLAYAGPVPIIMETSTSCSAVAWWSRRLTCCDMTFSLSRRRSNLVSSCCGVCATISMQSSKPTCPFSLTSGSFVNLIPTFCLSSAFLKRLECPKSASLEIVRFLKW
mmetsp:Transcript_80116/g.224880  ORF Transcript_80116/g.224880 Transcript_80116/m.224880 type:complete len:235 (+) Transcript_80116:377-1081(+)